MCAPNEETTTKARRGKNGIKRYMVVKRRSVQDKESGGAGQACRQGRAQLINVALEKNEPLLSEVLVFAAKGPNKGKRAAKTGNQVPNEQSCKQSKAFQS
jgi:hypothetical protein